MRRPAVLGGTPAFADRIPIARPLTPPLARVVELVEPSYERGQLTNGALVSELEERLRVRLGTAHVVAVSNCTAGLMLTLQALARGGDVVLPSFTFSASAHAVAWNGGQPRFAECDPRTFQADAEDLARRADGAAALMATHVFGAPCRAEVIEDVGRRAGLPVVFDAAHGLGGTRAGRPLGGFGDAEVFSMSPTKLVVAGEGGIVATSRDDVAEWVRLGRDYGNPGDYDTQFVGLNARMSEFHAAVALASLEQLDEHLARRRALAAAYTGWLESVPGIAPQVVEEGDESTFKDYTVAIDAEEYGLERDDVVAALAADGIDTRRYFYPPVHRQHAYAGVTSHDLPVTDRVASQVVSLPFHAGLEPAVAEVVVGVLASLHDHAEEVRAAA